MDARAAAAENMSFTAPPPGAWKSHGRFGARPPVGNYHAEEPFGVELYPTDQTTNNIKYTGQEEDACTGNLNLNFRMYQDAIGRFLKPDNIAGNPANPQSWNRYSYVHGNPVNITDPTGHFPSMPGQRHQGWINVSSYGHSAFMQTPLEAALTFMWMLITAGTTGGGGATVYSVSPEGKSLSGSAANPVTQIGPPNPDKQVYIYYGDLTDFVTNSVDAMISKLLAEGYTYDQIHVERASGSSSLTTAIKDQTLPGVNVFVYHHVPGNFLVFNGPPRTISDANMIAPLAASISFKSIYWGCYTSGAAYAATSQYEHETYGTIKKAYGNLSTEAGAMVWWPIYSY